MEQTRKDELRKIITKSIREQISEIESDEEVDAKFGDFNEMEAKGWLMDGDFDVITKDCKIEEGSEEYEPAMELYDEIATEIVREYYPEADFDY